MDEHHGEEESRDEVFGVKTQRRLLLSIAIGNQPSD